MFVNKVHIYNMSLMRYFWTWHHDVEISTVWYSLYVVVQPGIINNIDYPCGSTIHTTSSVWRSEQDVAC